MIEKAKNFLTQGHIDGWLIYDFHGNNPLARSFLNLSKEMMTTRRFFYWIPAKGEPIKLVHAIEAGTLNHLPGTLKTYSSWQSLEKELGNILHGMKKVAMEYSPKNAIPYVSLVDGGTVDLVRSFGVEVVSSADFLPHFTAVLTQKQIESQLRAGKRLDEIVLKMWQWIQKNLGKVTEYDAQQKIKEEFKKLQLITDHDPIVAVNAHSANPHYEPKKTSSSLIKQGDFILIDLWAKVEEGIFGDITRVAVAAANPSQKQQEIFQIVHSAQKAAIELVKHRFSEHKRLEGWEVDESARAVIRKAGYDKFFIHRTGHSIEKNLHGSGAHMDNLEMHDVRPILKGTCFSIEPGIYLPGEFGVRLELDLIVHFDGSVEISGGEQDSIACLY